MENSIDLPFFFSPNELSAAATRGLPSRSLRRALGACHFGGLRGSREVERLREEDVDR